jgi:hypothetical protein
MGQTYTLVYVSELDKLYFTSQNGTTHTLHRCNTDGTSLETVLTLSSFVPGIAIDQEKGKIYFAFWSNNEVRVTDLFAPTQPTLLFAGSNGTFQMCVSNVEDKLYFAEMSTMKIRKCNLDGTSPQDIITVTNTPMALAIQTVPPSPTVLEDRTYEFKLNNFISTGIDRNLFTKIQIQTSVDKGVLYLDANGNNIADAGETVTASAEVTKADLEAGKLKFNPALEESGDPYTQFTYKWYNGTQYSTLTYTVKITVLPEPVLAGGSAKAIEYYKSLPAQAIQPNITVSDLKDTDANSAVIKFTSGYITGEDVLDYTGTTPITKNWDATTGTLTLTGVNTLAVYQEILSQVVYKNIAATATNGTRTVSMTLIDNGKASNELKRNIVVAPLAGDKNDDGVITSPEIAGDVNEDGTIVLPEIVGDLNGDGKITAPEIAGDKNGDGKITAPEIAGDINGDGIITAPEIAGDLNGDGEITAPEIAGDTNGDGEITAPEIAGDKNGDGTITSPEICGDTNGDGNIAKPEIVGDANGDGKITAPEIAGDKNGDGTITAPEKAGDTNGDGTITTPEIAGDTNGDGTITVPEIAGDVNGDGTITLPEIAGDNNGDGTISSPEITGDVNGDGNIVLPEIAGDKNGDGTITSPEVAGDKNGNGVLDGDELPTTVQLSKQVNAMVVSAHGQIFILNPSADDVANVQVIDMTGKKVVSVNHMSVPLGKTQIESGTLAKGIYSVVVKGKKLDVIAKIVVK